MFQTSYNVPVFTLLYFFFILSIVDLEELIGVEPWLPVSVHGLPVDGQPADFPQQGRRRRSLQSVHHLRCSHRVLRLPAQVIT